MSASKATRAALYKRISDDREGLELGVRRQDEDGRKKAKSLGLTVIDTDYTDNDVGASTKSKKPRPRYKAMLADAEAGKFDYIIAYSNSRLTRRPMEYEDLIQLHERTGIRILTVVSGDDDLSTADGRMVARLKAVIDAAEAERIAERSARKHLQIAESGRSFAPWGVFGWEKNLVDINPKEAGLIRASADDLLAGKPLTAVAREWEAKGIRTRQGKAWEARTVKQYYLNYRHIGLRRFRGEVLHGDDGKPIKGDWKLILDKDTWERLQAKFEKNKRSGEREGNRKYLLSGLVRCGVCGGAMSGHTVNAPKRKGWFVYSCRSVQHGNAVSGPKLDELIRAMMLAYLADVETEKAPRDWEGESQLRGAESRKAELMKAYMDGDLTSGTVFPQVRKLEDQIKEMNKHRAEWLAETSGPVLEVESPEVWDDRPLEERRAMIGALLQAVIVKPAKRRGGNRFDYSRIDFEPRAGKVLPTLH